VCQTFKPAQAGWYSRRHPARHAARASRHREFARRSGTAAPTGDATRPPRTGRCRAPWRADAPTRARAIAAHEGRLAKVPRRRSRRGGDGPAWPW